MRKTWLRELALAATTALVLSMASSAAEARGGTPWMNASRVDSATPARSRSLHAAAALRHEAPAPGGQGGADLVAIADSHLGQGNFTRLPGAWCAWFVSAILRASGRAPLPNGMAASALAYGPLELHPRRGDLAVIATRAGRYGHVGIVVADRGRAIEIVSGNWGHRVARALIARARVTAFVRV
jgi:cell wall-associated NlpC family hydrolase